MGALPTAINLISSGVGLYTNRGIISGASNALTFSLGTSVSNPEIVFGDGSNIKGNPGIEIPERFGPLGGEQSIASHDFPGGVRTLQQLGAFPEPIRWRGVLLGSQAFGRAAAMDRMRINAGAKFLYLVYGPWQWQGLLTYFRGTARHQWWVDYEAEFEPFLDNSSVTPATATNQSQSLLSSVLSKLNGYLGNAALPSSIITSLSSALTTINGALLPAAGLISAVAPTDATNVLTAISAVSALTAVSATGSNLVSAAASGDLLSILMVAAALFAAGTAISTEVTTVNPNLPKLAAQYLGDQRQWPNIAKSNGLLDTMPIGVFKQLGIPAPAPTFPNQTVANTEPSTGAAT